MDNDSFEEFFVEGLKEKEFFGRVSGGFWFG